MIEKLNHEKYKELKFLEQSVALKDKLNEIIDIINARQVGRILCEVMPEGEKTWFKIQPAPKVGDLCYFWEEKNSHDIYLSILTQIKQSRFLDSNWDFWQYCQLAEIEGKPNYPEQIKKLIK